MKCSLVEKGKTMIQEHRLIDAKKALRVICKDCAMEFPNEPCEPTECFIRKAIEKTRTETYVEVVHGRWEHIKDYGGGNCFGYCSHCKTPIKANSLMALEMYNKYCPWCGAKMDGVKDHG